MLGEFMIKLVCIFQARAGKEADYREQSSFEVHKQQERRSELELKLTRQDQ